MHYAPLLENRAITASFSNHKFIINLNISVMGKSCSSEGRIRSFLKNLTKFYLEKVTEWSILITRTLLTRLI